jgi:hypothetical protein
MSGWTGLFRKSPKLKPDGTLRWFGKLPTYSDYYRGPQPQRIAVGDPGSNGGDAWAIEFNDWVMKGYEIYHTRASNSAAGGSPAGHRHGTPRLPVSGCVLRLPKSGMTVLASIQDYGGDAANRPFPLCFYVGLPTAQWPGPTSDGLAGAIRVLGQLMGLRREVIRFCNTPGRFESVFGNRDLELDGINGDTHDNGWIRQAAAISMTDWLAAARSGGGQGSEVGGRDLNPDTWCQLALRWGEHIRRLESPEFNPTLSFPLAAGLGWEVQTAGWIRWLESRMDLKRRTLSLIVTDEPAEAPARLVVIAREPMADDFLLLTRLGGTLPYLDDLSVVRDEEPAETQPPSAEDAQPGAAVPHVCENWRDFTAVPGPGA